MGSRSPSFLRHLGQDDRQPPKLPKRKWIVGERGFVSYHPSSSKVVIRGYSPIKLLRFPAHKSLVNFQRRAGRGRHPPREVRYLHSRKVYDFCQICPRNVLVCYSYGVVRQNNKYTTFGWDIPPSCRNTHKVCHRELQSFLSQINFKCRLSQKVSFFFKGSTKFLHPF